MNSINTNTIRFKPIRRVLFEKFTEKQAKELFFVKKFNGAYLVKKIDAWLFYTNSNAKKLLFIKQRQSQLFGFGEDNVLKPYRKKFGQFTQEDIKIFYNLIKKIRDQDLLRAKNRLGKPLNKRAIKDIFRFSSYTACSFKFEFILYDGEETIRIIPSHLKL